MLSTNSFSKLKTNSPDLSSEDTPQSFWINSFQRKANTPLGVQRQGDFKKMLLSDLARAMEQFPADQFRTDYYFLLIWLAYINLQYELHGDEDDCRKMFKMMKSSHIGLQHPEFFMHWAAFELGLERRDKCLQVLASAEELPIMRGNNQLKMVKDRIEAGKPLNLEPLYKLNTESLVKQAPAIQNHNTTNRTVVNISSASMELRTPSSIIGDFSMHLDEDKTATRLRRIGLGPPKRVNLDPTLSAAPSVPLTADKENIDGEQRRLNSLETDKLSKAAFPAPDEPANEGTNNSNMSFTMTEINAGIIETVAAPLPVEPIKAVPSSDTATLNITNATNLHVLPEPNPSSSNVPTATATTPASSKSRQVRVNGKVYRVLQLIGRGGSSKVFQVINSEGRIFALKKVSLKNLDENTIAGYANEIQLLRSFSGNPHIIQLMDSEFNRDAACLYILMEFGEVDLGRMLKSQCQPPGAESSTASARVVDENFIRFSWQQMLQAVQSVHEAKIVHCDLKPANFLLVQGSLKLIDFGISKAIMNDTTNIIRENQVGTVNYMSPEALQESSTALTHDRGRLKIGRPSDIWSLGCILYEMVYGRPPFAHFQTLIQRLHKILDPSYAVEYPPHSTGTALPNPDLIAAIKGCLVRSPKERLTLQQLLQHPFLRPPPSAAILLTPQQVIVSRQQIHSLLHKFAEAYPSINPDALSERIFQQWQNECKKT